MNGRRKAWKREDLAQSRYDFQLRGSIYHALFDPQRVLLAPIADHVDF